MNDDIRIFRSDANEALVRLAQLDSQRPPDGPVLAAEVDGQLRAALPLDGGAALADPFQHTAGLVSLLQLRLAQQRSTVRRAGPLGRLGVSAIGRSLGRDPGRDAGRSRWAEAFGRGRPRAGELRPDRPSA